MHIIKSINGQTVLFEDNEMFILKNTSISREQRLFAVIFIFSIAITGIIINLSAEKLYSLLAFIFLLLYGVIYVYIHFIREGKKVPEQIAYSDINKIDFISSPKRDEIIFYFGKEIKTFKISTKNLNIDVIKFLESKSRFAIIRK
ncbi:MAG: hypothetical protein ACFCUM_19545 [Bacteroidales bacterium]